MKQVIFVMKLFLIKGILISCQQDDVVSAKKPDQPQLHSSLKTDPENSINGDAQGGPKGAYESSQDVETTLNGYPYILKGHKNGSFSTGYLNSYNLVDFRFKEANVFYPSEFDHANQTETLVQLGFTHVEKGIDYVVQAYVIGVIPQYQNFVKNFPVRVLLGLHGSGQSVSWVDRPNYVWNFSETDRIPEYGGYWQITQTMAYERRGKMTVTKCQINSQGRLDLSCEVVLDNKTLIINKTNLERLN